MTQSIETINPATGEALATYTMMTNEERDQVIRSCHGAFLQWRHEAPEARAEVIRSIGNGLKAHKDELASLMTREMGKLLSQSEQEVDLVAAICEWTAANGPDALQDEERELPNGQGRGIITYAPIGVIYGI